MYRILQQSRSVALALAIAVLLLTTGSAWATDAYTLTPEQICFNNWLVSGLSIAIILVTVLVAKWLKVLHDNGTLKDFLSEPQPAPPAAPDPNQQPQAAQPLPPGQSSASRLIAFVGMIYILILFVGVGLSALHNAPCDSKTLLEGFKEYFYAGGLLFTPYLANRLSGILKP